LTNSLSGITPEPLPGIAEDRPDLPARILRWYQIIRDQVREQYDSDVVALENILIFRSIKRRFGMGKELGAGGKSFSGLTGGHGHP
jgi:hypothetical protein